MFELFATSRYKMKIASSLSRIAGGLILPSGVPFPTLERRDMDRHRHLARRLLDPQIYLIGLNPAAARSACAKLASYPFFPVKKRKAYDSGKMTQAKWRRDVEATIHRDWEGALPEERKEIRQLCRTVVQVQSELGCEALILPGPMTADPGTDLSSELLWLDEGMRAADGTGTSLPRLATLCVADGCLRAVDPWENEVLDIAVDQLSARPISGVYLLVEQGAEPGYYCAHPNTVGSLFRLVWDLKRAGVGRVVVPFCGTASLLLGCLGAETVAVGWYRGERRLKITDFDDQEGRSVPTYYSHALASEFHLESDLDVVVAAGFLEAIADETEASSELIRALRRGEKVSSVAEWEYRFTNVQAAIEHYQLALLREAQIISSLAEADRLTYATAWLVAADRLASRIYPLQSFNPRTELKHQGAWRQAFERLLSRLES